MQHQVPIIDMTVALSDNFSAELFEELSSAIKHIGVIQIVNHGIPRSLLEDYNSRMSRLFSLPMESKMAFASASGHPHRGWRPWLDESGRLEVERYHVAQFDTPEEAKAAGLAIDYLELYTHPNLWPPDDAELRRVTMRYMAAASAVAQQVLGLYAKALGLPPDTFSLGDLPHVRLTSNSYPEWSNGGIGRDADKLLLLEHADGSMLSVLNQEGDYEGLQVQQPNGDWLPVPNVPSALLVFSGRLLTHSTAGLLPACRHRVVAGGNRTRRSTAIFCYPPLSSVIQPLQPFATRSTRGHEPFALWSRVKDAENYLARHGPVILPTA